MHDQPHPNQNRQSNVEALIDRIREGVAQLTSSEEWQTWLRVQARFHRYSAHNTLLIWLARPDATRVAGFHTWKRLGRRVRKGERGIPILAPVIRKRREDDADERLDDDTDGRGRVVAYTRAHVFDVSQTDGEPLPSPHQLVTDDAERGEAAFETLYDFALGELGIPVYLEDLPPGGANGYITLTDQPRIIVARNRPPAHRAKTLAHELGHALLHLGDGDFHDRAVKEVEAESVAFCVMHHFGIDSGCYSFPYVATWSGGDPEAVVAACSNVQRAVKRVLGSAGALTNAS